MVVLHVGDFIEAIRGFSIIRGVIEVIEKSWTGAEVISGKVKDHPFVADEFSFFISNDENSDEKWEITVIN